MWSLKNKIRSLLWVALVGSPMLLSAQDKAMNPFVSPFDFPLVLSGNFGELRPIIFMEGLTSRHKVW
jgi:hypothetical protein